MPEGYEIARLDELESFPVDDEGLTWRPVRRRFDIRAFGINAYTAEAEGSRVVEEHAEQEGHDEVYVVLRGRATFTLDADEVDAPAGTFVYVRPGTRRGAVAREAGTAVLAVGAKRGELFTPSPWESIFAGFGHLKAGREEEGRKEIEEAVAANPDLWQGHFNLACFHAQTGRRDEALAALRRAVELEPAKVREWAASDTDFDSMRDDPAFREIVGG